MKTKAVTPQIASSREGAILLSLEESITTSMFDIDSSSLFYKKQDVLIK